MKGVQSFPGLGITLKHFSCNNQEENRFFVNEHVHERELREIYLRNFQIPIELGKPYSIMTSYNLVNGYHTPNHKEVLQKVVHNEGMIMTDWCITMDCTYACAKSEPIYKIAVSRDCIITGNDLQMPGCIENEQDIIEGVEKCDFKIEDLQACALRILKCCYLYQKK